ncbi:MAG: hypothetical protein JNM41_09535 [Flavipsychrobacter sp.]|nr:hypothetical protein [Flavipsychrobacter sp.]
MEQKINPEIQMILPGEGKRLLPILNIQNVNQAYAHLLNVDIDICKERILAETALLKRLQNVCKTADFELIKKWANKFNQLKRKHGIADDTWPENWLREFSYWMRHEDKSVNPDDISR